MDSPIRKAQKRNDYQRHKLFRKMKRQRENRRKQETLAAEKELKRRLRRPRFDEGSDDKVYKNVAPLYRSNNSVGGKAGRILSADPETNTALWQDEKTGRKRTISLPESYWIESNVPEMMFSEAPDQGEINEVIPSNAGIKRMHNALYPLSNQYYNDPILGSYARFTDSWNNNTNPVRAIWNQPATQIATADLLAGKGLKLLQGASKVNYAKLGNMSLKELDEYFNAHPSLVKKMGEDAIENYKTYFNTNLRPRFQAALAELNIPYTKEVEESIARMPQIYQADFGPTSKWGGYATSNGKIMLNSNNRIDPYRIDLTLAHEMHHNWRNNFGEMYRSYPRTDVQMNPYKTSTFNFIEMSRAGYTPNEIKSLERAYQFPESKFAQLKDMSAIKEKGATNAEIVARISKDFGGATGEELNTIIKELPRSKVEEYLNTTNGYSKSFKKSKTDKWYKDVKDSWIAVAGGLPFIVLNDSVSYMRGKDLKRPKFAGGSDDIVPKTTYTITERTMPNGSKIYFDEDGNELTPTTLGLVNKSGTVLYTMPDITPFEDWKWNSNEQQELNAQQRLGQYMQNAPAKDIDKVMLGTLALGTAPVVASFAAPKTVGNLMIDTASGKMFNSAYQLFSGREYGDMLWDKWNIPKPIGEYLNPGFFLRGGVNYLANSAKNIISPKSYKIRGVNSKIGDYRSAMEDVIKKRIDKDATFYQPPNDREKRAFHITYRNMAEDVTASQEYFDYVNKISSGDDYIRDRLINLFDHNPEYAIHVLQKNVKDPLSLSAINDFIERLLTSLRGVVAKSDDLAKEYLTETRAGEVLEGGDRLGTDGGIYTTNNPVVSDRFKNPVGSGKTGTGYVGLLRENYTNDESLSIEDQLAKLRNRIQLAGTSSPFRGTAYELPQNPNIVAKEDQYVGKANASTGGHERAYLPVSRRPLSIKRLTEYKNQIDDRGRFGQDIEASVLPDLFLHKTLNRYNDFIQFARSFLRGAKKRDYAKIALIENVVRDNSKRRTEKLQQLSDRLRPIDNLATKIQDVSKRIPVFSLPSLGMLSIIDQQRQQNARIDELFNQDIIDASGDVNLQNLDRVNNNKPLYRALRWYLQHYNRGKSGIYIKPKNRGKFNALKKRTGKTTEELTHSKNPLTRKRAIFAQNARKWKH